MEFVKNALDYGTAPEVYVDSIQRVSLLSRNIVRVTLCMPFPRRDMVEMRTAVHLLWDRQRFLDCTRDYERARTAMALSTAFRVVGRD